MTGELADGVMNENVDDTRAPDRRSMRVVNALLAGEIEGQALWFLPIFPAPDGVAVPKSPTIPDA